MADLNPIQIKGHILVIVNTGLFWKTYVFEIQRYYSSMLLFILNNITVPFSDDYIKMKIIERGIRSGCFNFCIFTLFLDIYDEGG